MLPGSQPKKLSFRFLNVLLRCVWRCPDFCQHCTYKCPNTWRCLAINSPGLITLVFLYFFAHQIFQTQFRLFLNGRTDLAKSSCTLSVNHYWMNHNVVSQVEMWPIYCSSILRFTKGCLCANLSIYGFHIAILGTWSFLLLHVRKMNGGDWLLKVPLCDPSKQEVTQSAVRKWRMTWK